MNNVFVLKPFKMHGCVWVFSDPVRGLTEEPFVSSACEVIDLLVENLGIKNADNGFLLYFSDKTLKVNHIKLNFISRDGDWTTYQLEGTEMQPIFCPALLKYWENPPEHIYAYAESLK